MALAQLVGGGTAVVSGSMRGNVGIASGQQAQAAARQHGATPVNNQLTRQQNINAQLNKRQQNQLNRNGL